MMQHCLLFPRGCRELFFAARATALLPTSGSSRSGAPRWYRLAALSIVLLVLRSVSVTAARS